MEVKVGNFTFIATKIPELIVIEPKVYGDSRGFFLETYHKESFAEGGIEADFVQDNHSRSTKGVLRGMHFQVKNPQGKLVRVISGEVYDVAVDMRKNSTTFRQWYGLVLSEGNKKMMYVPEGFAHGFFVLSDYAEFTYKCTRFYDRSDESGFRYDDKTVDISWPLEGIVPLVSDKDLQLGGFLEASTF